MKKLFIFGVLCLLCSISAISQSKKEWERVQSLNSWNVYQQFVINYPDGKYTKLAKQKLAQLKENEANKKEIESNKLNQTNQNDDQKPQASKKEQNKSKLKDPIYSDDPTPRSVSTNNLGSSLNLALQNDAQIVLKKKSAYLNDKNLTRNELKDLLLSDPKSAIEYNKAKENATVGMVPMILGTGLALYGSIVSLSSSVSDANSISSGKIETTDPPKYMTPIIAGCGLVLIGIPFIIASNSHIKKSINLYNSKQTTGYNSNQKLELGLTQNGVGLVYRF